MFGGCPDLLILKSLEGSLSPYEEELLLKILQRGGAVADRFVELRELERGLVEVFGGRRKLAGVLVAGLESGPSAGRSRARRYSTPPCAAPEPAWPREVLEAYGRWLISTDPSAHRSALGRCLGMVSDELQDVLRCRHAMGMNCREIAEHLARGLQDVEELLCKIQGFLAACIRLRLSRHQHAG